MTGSSTLLRQATALCALLAVALAVVLMAVKQQVRALEDELNGLHQRIAFERQSLQVLTAEFNFFTEPERLKRLAGVHLGLVPIEPRQLAGFAILDEPPPDEPLSGGAVAARPLGRQAPAMVSGARR